VHLLLGVPTHSIFALGLSLCAIDFAFPHAEHHFEGISFCFEMDTSKVWPQTRTLQLDYDVRDAQITVVSGSTIFACQRKPSGMVIRTAIQRLESRERAFKLMIHRPQLNNSGDIFLGVCALREKQDSAPNMASTMPSGGSALHFAMKLDETLEGCGLREEGKECLGN